MKKVIAMILAGGRGRRMGILCEGRPKPALPFAGRFRVIDFSLSNCIHSQIGNIAVLTDYRRSQIANYLRKWRLCNVSTAEFSVLEPKASSYKGTADAIYQNFDYTERANADVALILAGDHIYTMDYHQMLAFHDQMKADVTIGVRPVPIEEAHRFGIVTVDVDGRIVDFVEKPRFPKSNLISMGIYVFDREILRQCLTEDAVRPDSVHDFGYSIIPRTVKQHRVFAYKFNNYWRDIGTAASYYETNIEFCNGQEPLSLGGRWPILTDDDGPAELTKLEKVNVENSIISPGCVINGHVESSILSPGVRVEERAVVRNSVLMANASVGSHSIVERCVLDEGVSIGEFCHIGVGTTPLPAKDDVTVLSKNVTVPSYTVISRNCKILSHTRFVDFATNAIPGCYHFAAVSASLCGAFVKEKR